MQNKAFSMEDLFAFLNAGVSAFHSTAAAAAILEAEGYRNCPESAAWHLVPGGKYYTTRNGSAILAWRMPKGPLTGWHAAASHSDSPTWRIKTLDGADHGFARAEVEGYGGMLMSTWFDRPLSVRRPPAGAHRRRRGEPSGAPGAGTGLHPEPVHPLQPGGQHRPELQPPGGPAAHLRGRGRQPEGHPCRRSRGKGTRTSWPPTWCSASPKRPSVSGLQGEYFMSGRIDDLECAYATLYGFLQGRGEEAGRGDIWVTVRQRGSGLFQPAGRTGQPDERCAGPH